MIPTPNPVIHLWVYLTSEKTGTVHLADSEAAAQTLCGRKFKDEAWIQGDETISGIAATCGSCRRISKCAPIPLYDVGVR